jgi:hypothetical protein
LGGGHTQLNSRPKLVAALKGMRAWDGHGLHPAEDVAARLPSPCELFGVVRDGAFARQYPSGGFDCSGGGLMKVG